MIEMGVAKVYHRVVALESNSLECELGSQGEHKDPKRRASRPPTTHRIAQRAACANELPAPAAVARVLARGQCEVGRNLARFGVTLF